MSRLHIILAATFFLPCVYAQENQAEQKGTTVQLQEAKDDEVPDDRDSRASIAETDRDPFWPVDYLPQDEQLERTREQQVDLDAQEQKKMARRWSEAQAMLVVSGFSRMGDEGYFAIVNGEMVRTGDTVGVETAAGSFYWKITAIDDDGIRFKRMRAETK